MVVALTVYTADSANSERCVLLVKHLLSSVMPRSIMFYFGHTIVTVVVFGRIQLNSTVQYTAELKTRSSVGVS